MARTRGMLATIGLMTILAICELAVGSTDKPVTRNMILVPAGEFWMGSDDGRYSDERPRHRVELDAFYIDMYEVTNSEFAAFIDGSGYERSEFWDRDGWLWRSQARDELSGKIIKGPRLWTVAEFNRPNQPVVGVSWYEADAFCRYVGKRLPTEAEWEKAARGTDARQFPWGNDWDPRRLNSQGPKVDERAVVTDRGINVVPLLSLRPKMFEVGSFPNGVSPYGVHDMAGNASEWVADWYDRREYQKRAGLGVTRNPKGPQTGYARMHRGGHLANFQDFVFKTTARVASQPSMRDGGTGLRCAQSG